MSSRAGGSGAASPARAAGLRHGPGTFAVRLAGAGSPAPSISPGPSRGPDPRPGRWRGRRLPKPFPALLAGMLPLFATAPTWAQDAVWSATLSTDWSSEYKAISDIDFFGCVNGLSFIVDCSDPTKLTDDDFTHGTPSATYTRSSSWALPTLCRHPGRRHVPPEALHKEHWA